MKFGTGGNLGLSREYHKKLYGPLFYSWWNCPLNKELKYTDERTVPHQFTHYIVQYTNMTSLWGVCTTEMDPHKGDSFLLYTPQGCHICFVIPNKI